MVEAEGQEKQQREQYRKRQTLGEGAFGKAYLVQSRQTDKLWVIKKVDLGPLSYDDRKSARQEADLLRALNHPNIIQFKDVFRDKNFCLNLVMEYADGGELSDMIRQRRQDREPFAEEEILNYFTQICLALKHCHDRKILHRDLKSQNIFMTRSGLCKLGDFGISRVLHGTN